MCTKECPSCESGVDHDRYWLQAFVQLIMIAGSEGCRGGKSVHPWLAALTLAPRSGSGTVIMPTQAMSDLSGGLAGRHPERGVLGHDHGDLLEAMNKILIAAGLDPKIWGVCKRCEGHGYVPGSVCPSCGSYDRVCFMDDAGDDNARCRGCGTEEVLDG